MDKELRLEFVRFPKEITPLTDSYDTAHWGLTDLYDDAEAKLRELLASGKPFNTGWCSSKKEIASFRLRCDETEMCVEVCQDIDDVSDWSLLTDAVYDLDYKEDDFSEEDYELMADEASFAETTWTAERYLEMPVTYDQVMDAINDAFDETDRKLEEEYDFVKRIVQEMAEDKGLQKRQKGE